MPYRMVREKTTVNFGVYVDEDDRCKGKLYIPLSDFDGGQAPEFLTMELTPREKPRNTRARKA